MKKYLNLIKLAFTEKLSFRGDYILTLFSGFVIIYVLRSLWTALYQETLNIPEASLDQMLQYASASTIMMLVLSVDLESILEAKIRTGDICMDLIRPIPFQNYYLFRAIGEILFNVLLKALPLGVLACLLFDFSVPPLGHLICFIFSFFCSAILFIFLSLLVGTICFWTKMIWSYVVIKRLLIVFLSGMIVPLWFFPKLLKDIIAFLPFQYLYYTPLSLFVGRVGIAQLPLTIAKQIFWIALFVLAEKILLKKALSNMNIQGG